MRLLRRKADGTISLTKDLDESDLPSYAILSHTWGTDEDEVSFEDMATGRAVSKTGYQKIRFCAYQAQQDRIEHFWIDTCCINKSNHAELSEALISMFRWYQKAERCCVFLSDVRIPKENIHPENVERILRGSLWFTRGWTLQELIAPASVEFFLANWYRVCSKSTHEDLIGDITRIPIKALRGETLSNFSLEERFAWQAGRKTRKPEDMVYSLMGIFDVSMPVLYGEGLEKARRRLDKELGMPLEQIAIRGQPPYNASDYSIFLLTSSAFGLHDQEDTENAGIPLWDTDRLVAMFAQSYRGVKELVLRHAPKVSDLATQYLKALISRPYTGSRLTVLLYIYTPPFLWHVTLALHICAHLTAYRGVIRVDPALNTFDMVGERRLLSAGAVWELLQSHPLYLRGMVGFGEVCESLKRSAKINDKLIVPMFAESDVRRVIEEVGRNGGKEIGPQDLATIVGTDINKRSLQSLIEAVQRINPHGFVQTQGSSADLVSHFDSSWTQEQLDILDDGKFGTSGPSLTRYTDFAEDDPGVAGILVLGDVLHLTHLANTASVIMPAKLRNRRNYRLKFDENSQKFRLMSLGSF